MRKLTVIIALLLMSAVLSAAIISDQDISADKLASLISRYYPDTYTIDESTVIIDPEWTALTLYLDTDYRTILLSCYWLLDESITPEEIITAANEWNKGNMIPTAYYDDSDHSLTADYAMTWADDGIPSGMLMESVRWMDEATILLGAYLSDCGLV